MKKGIITFLTLLAGIVNASADNVVTVKDVTVLQGMKATIAVELNNSDDITAFQMDLTLPDDITLESISPSERFVSGQPTGNHTLEYDTKGQVTTITSYSAKKYVYAGNTGTLFTVTISADASLAVGSKLTAKLSGMELTKTNVEALNPEDITFTITIGEPIVELDEDATTLPEAMNNVNVRVLRTINANEWGTICLPFAMTEAQTKAAFGDDVKLGDFNGYETKEDADENIVGITVKFNNASAIEANHPYVIKTSQAITNFTVNGVDIDAEDEPMVNFGTSRKPKAIVGNYINGSTIENGCLFLSGGAFHYSVGKTKMRAFRAYFDFNDLLTDFEDNYASSRIFISFDNNTTGIENHRMANDDDRY